MQNQLELEKVSVRLYTYLCEEVVGSENVVKYRRLYYKLHDDISTNTHKEIISSGSKAEGLDLPGSDIDIMVLWKDWEVYEKKPTEKEDVLMLDTDNALPGFALLKKANNSSFPFPPTKTSNGNLISNSVFHAWGIIGQDANILKIHGPCLSCSMLIDIDILCCLKCHLWPTAAKQWLLRSRPSGWPSQDIISEIVSHGVLLVPVGSKSFSSEGNPFEWRFSFSLSEKLLVYSLNHTQLLCYALLKIWLKELLNSDSKLNNKLCSYFIKTVLFWILEENENLNWVPQNLLHCFFVCIRRLHYWIDCGYFPSYFIPEHNMIDGKLSNDDLAYLSFTLDIMNMSENWKIVFSVPSLRNFRNLPISITRKDKPLSEFDRVAMSVRTFGSMIKNSLSYLKEDSLSACIIYRMIHKDLPNSARKCLSLMFLKENKSILKYLDFVNCKNKRIYLSVKESLSRILINTFDDVESGWLLLAGFFYSTKKYNEMSYILQLLWNIISLKNPYVQNDVNIHYFRDISNLKKMVYSGLFIKRMKYERSRVFRIDYQSLPESYPFLTEEIPKRIYGGFRSYNRLFFLFLIFLYSRIQGNSLEAQYALQLLKTIVEEESDKSTNIFALFSSCTLLLKACELCSDDVGYLTCFLRFSKAFKKLDTFEPFMKYIENDEEIKLLFELE